MQRCMIVVTADFRRMLNDGATSAFIMTRPVTFERIASRKFFVASGKITNKLFEPIVHFVDVFYELVVVGAAKPRVTLVTLKVFVLIVRSDSVALEDLLGRKLLTTYVARPNVLLLLLLMMMVVVMVVGLRPEVLLHRYLFGNK
jgi:hypothetical protein